MILYFNKTILKSFNFNININILFQIQFSIINMFVILNKKFKCINRQYKIKIKELFSSI